MTCKFVSFQKANLIMDAFGRHVRIQIQQGDITNADTESLVRFIYPGADDLDGLLDSAGDTVRKEYAQEKAKGGLYVNRGVVCTSAGNIGQNKRLFHVEVRLNEGTAKFRTALHTTLRSADRQDLRSIAFPGLALCCDEFLNAYMGVVYEFEECENPRCLQLIRTVIPAKRVQTNNALQMEMIQMVKYVDISKKKIENTYFQSKQDAVKPKIHVEDSLPMISEDKEPTQAGSTVKDSQGLEWKFKHHIDSWGELNFVASDHLTICKLQNVEVHHVNREETRLLYTLASDEWRGSVYPCDVAVSESMPGCILVICDTIPYVYQFQCHDASNHVKKYQIHDGNVVPWCIAANANTAVIGLIDRNALVVCSLPGFTQQRIVDLSFTPCDLTISRDYLVVMGYHEMVIKPMGDLGQDLCRIKPPDGWGFKSVSYRNDARQLYAACYHWSDGKGRVCKYTWDRNDTTEYHNTGCVIDNVSDVRYKGLSITSYGLLAVAIHYPCKIKIFSLE
ncbi:uncharacterized protein [Amphiura filiformis]|uniref:uncharacterized protein n=1 Tax=Amphiura filiformis TaxID=82378 RepID=UPI003B2100AD